MIELKTLKDFVTLDKGELTFKGGVKPEDLRQEAIKQIKAFEELIKEFPNNYQDVHMWKGIIDYIKRFNNIKEED